MSTYTDLHNRVKENITVDYNNRITPQQVRFFNEQNEYWGTLRGHISAENINVEGGTLRGVTLDNAILNGSVILPDGLDLYKIMQNLKQISVDLIQTTDDLQQEKIDRISAVTIETNARKTAVANEAVTRYQEDNSISTVLSNAISGVNTDIQSKLDDLSNNLTIQDYCISTLLSSDLSAERKARIEADEEEHTQRTAADEEERTQRTNADTEERTQRTAADNYLSDEIDTANAIISRETFDRTAADDKIELSIANEVANSIARDIDISTALSVHIDDNNKQFACLSAEMLSTVEHERHYVINMYTGSMKTTDVWPYSCKDFAVNIYNPTLNDGTVYYKDESAKNFEIGSIYKDNPNTILPFTFKTYGKIQHSGIASALNSNYSYGFTENKKTQKTDLNDYDITFNDIRRSEQLSDHTLDLIPSRIQYHKIKYGNTMIGKVLNAFPDGYCEDIISGQMWFDTTDTELCAFNVFKAYDFNDTDLSSRSAYTERVKYIRNNRLILEKSIISANFIGLSDSCHEQHYQFGRIYDTYDSISGIIKDNDEISQINVRLSNPYNKMLNLNRDSGFKGLIEEDVKSGDVYYNTILSATVDNLSGTFDEVKVSELYKYDFTTINEDGTEVVGGYVVPKKYNKTLAETRDFTSVDINIEDVMWITAFKHTYTLTKADEVFWRAEAYDDDDNILNIKFNGNTVYIKVTSGLDGSIIRQQHPVKVYEPQIFNTDSCHEHVYKTELTDLSRYNQSCSAPQATYEVNIDSNYISEEFKRYELNINTATNEMLKIQVPNRTTLDIAREFMVVIKPESDKNQLIKLMFVDENGQPVQITSNRRGIVLVPTNKWTTFQVKEINNNVFLVVDLDQNQDAHDIEFLSNAIDTEISNRISNDAFLSNTIDLSVENLQKQVLSNDADIADIYEKIKGGISYKGVVYGQIKDSSSRIVDIPTISNLFVWKTHGYSINHYEEDTVLSNGFMYLVKTLDGSQKTKFNIEGIDIESRDYIIINCRHTDDECNGKEIRYLTSADIDVIDAEDADVIHRPELSTVSSLLCAEIKTNADKIESLSTELSIIKVSDVSGFTFLSTNISYVSSEVSCNISKIENLSGKVEFILSVDKETMNYKGTLPYLPNLSNDITHEDLGYNYLSALIIQNMGIHAPGRLKLGDFFKLSAVQSCLYDANNTSCWFGENDYFVVNKDSIVYDITKEDIDIFRNAESEVLWLSSQLCAEINSLSASLSNTIKLSVDNLQNQIISNDNDIAYLSSEVSCNDNDIEFLSVQHDWLSSELSTTLKLSVDNLQNQIISNDNDIAYLSSEVSCNDNDIEFLSNDLSTLKYKHYNKTLSTDIELTHQIPGQTYLSVVDQLLLLDEITFDTYRLTIRNGALNINLVKKFQK